MTDFRTEGHVDFPTGSKIYTHNGQNGLSVYLVVEEDEPQAACVVNSVHLKHDEVFIEAYPQLLEPDDEKVEAHARTNIQDWPESVAEFVHKDVFETLSREYATVIRMGSTDWVGTTEDYIYWIATSVDLTKDGLKLFDAVQQTYPDATLRLITALDTQALPHVK